VVKVLFFGTPQIAVPFLERLIEQHHVVGVVCKPDEPVGRGYTLTPPPTKVAALKHKLPVFQPHGPWTAETIKLLTDLGADVGIAVAYGRLMPESVYAAPRLGTLNVHFSLLPKYRGAGPMQWALINGEKETGVTMFWLETQMDTGPIFRQDKIAILPSDDALTLKEKLINLGVSQMSAVLTDIESGKIIREPQVGAPCLAPMLKKEDGRIVWNKSSNEIVNLVRGVAEWPVASTKIGGKTLKIHQAVLSSVAGKKEPGTIVGADKNGISIQTGQGVVTLKSVQPEGKKGMDAWAFWQGARLNVGEKCE
jgi:methionyl-tRNA formyltransferase